MMVMMTTIVALFLSLFLVQQDCPFIAILGGRADITERKFNLFEKIRLTIKIKLFEIKIKCIFFSYFYRTYCHIFDKYMLLHLVCCLQCL